MRYDDVFGNREHINRQAGQLWQYARNELSASQAAALELHLDDCATCRLAVAEMERANGPLGAENLWDWAREAIRKCANHLTPSETEHFDAVWFLMERRGILGAYYPSTQIEPDPQIGFVPSTSEGAKLPALIGVLSNMIADAQSQGTSLPKVVNQHLADQEAFLRNVAGFTSEELRQLSLLALKCLTLESGTT